MEIHPRQLRWNRGIVHVVKINKWVAAVELPTGVDGGKNCDVTTVDVDMVEAKDDLLPDFSERQKGFVLLGSWARTQDLSARHVAASRVMCWKDLACSVTGHMT